MTPARRLAIADPAPDRRLELAADGFLSVADAAAFLAVSRSELYVLMTGGEVRWAKLGRRRVVSRRSLTEFAASRMGEE